MHTLQNLFEVTTLLDVICLHLELQDIFALKRTTKSFTWIFNSFYKRRWSVNRHLQRFVTNPVGLRSQLARHNAIISRGFALQFFADALWEDIHLDIYVKYDDEELCLSKQGIEVYLCEYEGYESLETRDLNNQLAKESSLSTDPSSGPSTDSLAQKRRVYIRSNTCTGFSSQINIIHTDLPPALHLLTYYCTTAAANLITWNKAYCIFPDSTFIHKTSYQLNFAVDDINGAYLTKYRRRGWMTLQTQWKEYERSNSSVPSSGRLSRHIGDSMTWKISLDTTGVAPSSIPDHVLEQSHFSIRKREDRTLPGNNGSHYEIHAKEFVSYVLRHTYIADSLIGKDFWCDFVGPRLDELTRLQFLGVAPEKRPGWLQQGDGRGVGGMTGQFRHLGTDGFERGNEWTYWDHMVPKWYEIWSREGKKGG